jgi:hypothetical protein
MSCCEPSHLIADMPARTGLSYTGRGGGGGGGGGGTGGTKLFVGQARVLSWQKPRDRVAVWLLGVVAVCGLCALRLMVRLRCQQAAVVSLVRVARVSSGLKALR